MSYALVTGAATGMGVEYARQLAKRGYNLILVDINPRVEQTAQQVQTQYNVLTRSIVMDLGTADAADTLYQQCRQENLPVEVLINNAGLYHGLCQWGEGRLSRLYDWCYANGFEPDSLEGQLNYMRMELEGSYAGVLAQLQQLIYYISSL